MMVYPSCDPRGQEALAGYFRQSLAEHLFPQIELYEKAPQTITYTHNFVKAQDVFEDILPSIEANGLYQINYVGGMGRGKTTSAEEFATISRNKGFLVVYGKAEDIFPNQREWQAAVKQKIIEHGNQYLTIILDDMSYSSNTISPKKASEWKHFIGNIRHEFENVLGEGIKPKIFLMIIAHRYHAVPPILRTGVSWIFASMDNEDRIDAIKMLPKDPKQVQRLDKIYSFLQKVNIDGPKNGKIPLGIGIKRAYFIWGNEETPGDGRLMMLYHKSKVQIFNPQRMPDSVNLYECEIKQPAIKEDLAPAPALDPRFRFVSCNNCQIEIKTKIAKGSMVRCTKCRKVIESEFKEPKQEQVIPSVEEEPISFSFVGE